MTRKCTIVIVTGALAVLGGAARAAETGRDRSL